MKRLNLFFLTLFATVLPMTICAEETELKRFDCTFSGATDGTASETYAIGTLNTTEGNDWIWNAPGESKSPVLQMTEVGGKACLSANLKTSSLELTSDFSVPGKIQTILITAGGNIGTIRLDFGEEYNLHEWKYTDNNLHSIGFGYEQVTKLSTLPRQRIKLIITPKDETSGEPIYLRYVCIDTKVMKLGINDMVSKMVGFDEETYTLKAEDKAYDWKMALPYSGVTLETAGPAAWSEEECLYLRVVNRKSSYTTLSLISANPVVGKVKKIIVSAGGDVRSASYTKRDEEIVFSNGPIGSVSYYYDYVIDLGEGEELEDNIRFDLYTGTDTYLKSIIVIMEDGNVETLGITSTFYDWEEWNTTNSYMEGSLKAKESTPWNAVFFDPKVSVYPTMYSFTNYDNTTMTEQCMVFHKDNDNLEFNLMNLFDVSGTIHKIIVRCTGGLANINATVYEHGTGEGEQHSSIQLVNNGWFTDAELTFDGTTEYTNADIRLNASGTSPIFLQSITIVQEGNNGGGGGGNEPEPDGMCGESLYYTITPLPYTTLVWDYETYESVEVPANKLTITGTGEMYDYDEWTNTVPWENVNVESITEIELPDGITHVGNYAFYGCYHALVNKLPESLTSIGAYAFYNLLNWSDEDLRLPSNLTYVGPSAFIFCDGIKNLYLPASLTYIGDAAFSSIFSLENFYVDGANPVYKADGNAIIEKATNTLIAANNNTVIPDYIETIGNSAFSRVSNETVSIPNSVTKISQYAFSSSYITSIDIPSSVTTIGYYTFGNCSKLLKATIGSGVTTIDANVFYGCTNILDVFCYANPEALTWVNTNYEAYSFKPDKMTKMHVLAADLEKWQEKFGFLNVTFVGDLGGTVAPITEETVIAVSSLENMNLSDSTIDGIYYNLNASTGNGYNSGCLVIGQTTDMSLINDGAPGSDDVRDNFTGIILKVGPGKGIIAVNAKSIGKTQLAVRIGDGTPTYAGHNERWETYVSYNVTEATYVYIYAVGNGTLVKAFDREVAEPEEDALLIYGITIMPGTDEDAIKDIEQDQMANGKSVNDQWFDLSGKKLQGLPAKNGIYIKNGKKVVIK